MLKLSIPYPTLGLDLDGTITESKLFFNVLTNSWPGKIIIVTYRANLDSAIKDLESMYIKYDQVVLAKTMDKSKIIKEHKIDVYIDDQDEMIYDIPPETTVMKIRNGGNFDFDSKKWLYSSKTGKLI